MHIYTYIHTNIYTYTHMQHMVVKTNGRKSFFMEVPPIYDNCSGSSFMEYKSPKQTFSLLQPQFCFHVKTSAVALKVRCLGTSYFNFLRAIESFFILIQPCTFNFQIPATSKYFQWTIESQLMIFQAVLIIHWYKRWISNCQLTKIMEDLRSSWLRTAEVVSCMITNHGKNFVINHKGGCTPAFVEKVLPASLQNTSLESLDKTYYCIYLVIRISVPILCSKKSLLLK
jgi:hypothetical protein